MADATVASVDPPPIESTDCDSGLAVPPLDTAFFSQQFNANEGSIGDNRNDVVDDDLDFDFNFDDFDIPSAEDLDDLLNPDLFPEFDCQPGYGASFTQLALNVDQSDSVLKSTSSELRHASEDSNFSGDRSSNGSGVPNSVSSGLESHQVSSYLNVPSSESNGLSQGTSETCGSDVKVMNCPSPESRGSGNRGSNLSEGSYNSVTRSASYSPNSNNHSIRVGVVDQKIKLEEPSKNAVNSCLLKRKKDSEDLLNSILESRINKYRKSNKDSKNDGVPNEEEKKKARLIRNRESAQLSRQRKKHYVGELEEKIKLMHSTIQDLNAKVSYFMAENVTLRQQMCGNGAVPPLPMAPPPHGLYPHPTMFYPWVSSAPPYMMKPQGSQVPLVPIPRLKPKKITQVPKTKKVAGISFLGLLFFILLFGGLVPMITMRYGGVREMLTVEESYVGGGLYKNRHGRVLMVNGSEAGEKYGERRDINCESSLHCGHRSYDSGGMPIVDGFSNSGNVSEPLVASLYVPRNDKLVKIDGNLIIHSVLASEKALSSHGNGGGETALAVPGGLGTAVPIPGVQVNGACRPQLRALGSSSEHKDNVNPKASDGRLQQWFREGLAGPMLSSGMCTEVFQFEVSSASASGAIVPATTKRNISEEQNQNTTHLSKGRNRRILHGLPVPLTESSHNVSEQRTRRNPQKENLKRNNSASPMVVSVVVDPRDVGDADVDGVMGTKSISRIFVVVLKDSVKYVTYSCMLPFKGSALQLVTT